MNLNEFLLTGGAKPTVRRENPCNMKAPGGQPGINHT
jgi:hypothetical protein